jgi:hypothetical protein
MTSSHTNQHDKTLEILLPKAATATNYNDTITIMRKRASLRLFFFSLNSEQEQNAMSLPHTGACKAFFLIYLLSRNSPTLVLRSGVPAMVLLKV